MTANREERGAEPRILVFTVPAWNARVGADSWETLLSQYDSARIANICIRDEEPDSPVCSRYFTVSENCVLKSVFHRHQQTGFEKKAVSPDVPPEENEDLEEHNRRYARFRKKRRYSLLLAREVAWKLGRWKTPELDAFLDDFRPDIILHSMEGYIHLNRIIEYAIQRTGAQAIGYIWDDNFTYRQHRNFGYRFYRYFQRRSLKRLAAKTEAFFAISPMTKREADEFFGIDCTLLTKPIREVGPIEELDFQLPLHMLYTGNLYIGRDRTLGRVMEAMRTVNGDKSPRIILDVYTASDPAVLTGHPAFSPDTCRIHAAVPQAEVFEKQREAQVLLFAEDIDGPDALTARLSFSTKITDYLSAGRCILAVGCPDVAPMVYLREEEAALVAGNDEEITASLRSLTENPDTMRLMAARAYECGWRNHNRRAILERFDTVLMQVFRSGGSPTADGR